MNGNPLFRRHYQVAYVVLDMEAALAAFRDRFGISRWEVVDLLQWMGPESPVRCVANAFSQDTMIELIEAIPGRPSIFGGWADAVGGNIRLHHLAFLAASERDFHETAARFATDGIKIPNRGSFGGAVDYFHADTVADLGHYYELVHLKPEGRDYLDRIPRN